MTERIHRRSAGRGVPALPWVLAGVLATLVATAPEPLLAFAPTFEATAVFRIEQTGVSPDLVRWSPEGLGRKRVEEVRQTLLDPRRLASIVEREHLAAVVGEGPDALEALARRVRVEVVDARVGGAGQPASTVDISLSVSDDDAEHAQRLANALARAYVTGAAGAAAADAKLTSGTSGTAPAESAAGPKTELRALIERLSERAARLDDKVGRAEDERRALDARIADREHERARLAEELDRPPERAGTASETGEGRLARLRREYAQARATHPADDPGVRRLAAAVDALAAAAAVPGLADDAAALEASYAAQRARAGPEDARTRTLLGRLATARERLAHARMEAARVPLAAPSEVPAAALRADVRRSLVEVDQSLEELRARKAALARELPELREQRDGARAEVERHRSLLASEPSGVARASSPANATVREDGGKRYVLVQAAALPVAPAGVDSFWRSGSGALAALGVAALLLGLVLVRATRSSARQLDRRRPVPRPQEEPADGGADAAPRAAEHDGAPPPAVLSAEEPRSDEAGVAVSAAADATAGEEGGVTASVSELRPTRAEAPPALEGAASMYEAHFGLREKPFSLLPDPAFLYMSRQHSLSFAVLQYGLTSNAGLTVLSGEIGSGKTTLLRHLLNQIEEDVTVGLLTNTHPSFRELLQWICAAYGLEYENKGKVALHQAFVDFMIGEYAKGRRTVLIIDEAQNMSAATLEELRMLSNVNVDDHLLLQLILVGQPQLRDTLARPDLVQVAQRIAADYSLGGFEEAETHEYVCHRLRKVGGDPAVFESGTHELIHRYSRGIPRVINVLCDTALVYAYGSNRTRVTVETLHEVIRDRERVRDPGRDEMDEVYPLPGTEATGRAPRARARASRRPTSRPTPLRPAAEPSPLVDGYPDAPDLSLDDARELFSKLRDEG